MSNQYPAIDPTDVGDAAQGHRDLELLPDQPQRELDSGPSVGRETL